jgi:von Willebrand factor type A domain
MRPSTLPLSVLLLAGLPTVCAYAETGRSIALVLDASGSMNAKLPDGPTRIEAAKAAVADLVGRLPGDARLALRVYGHQSPTQQKNCQDTALMVGFNSVVNNKAAMVAAARGVHAQGYTPITYVLKRAAEDVGKEDAASRVVVLVSDGQETCAGDPCATAKALADADAKLVVHTIGLGVDGAARYQLRCIASVARGIYVDAGSATELAAALAKTAEAPARRVTTVTLARSSGKIKIVGAPPALHAVVNAASGQEVAKINTGHPSEVELPAGVYNVKFANGFWMGVEVTAGATTQLKPGFLKVDGRICGAASFSIPRPRRSWARAGEPTTASPCCPRAFWSPSATSTSSCGRRPWRSRKARPRRYGQVRSSCAPARRSRV